ncbi:MAG: fibronectin type III domain-containing protein, partial [Eubacterium sp.]|nr:fibronectin type III domain-containing protein [Eubacterium sp.]
MKKIKFISLILAVIMLLQFPITAYAETETYSPYVKGTYLQQEKMQNYTIVHGLDLSYHNGTVDFAKLAAQGVKYVILRVGYRGYGESAKLVYDTKYDEFYASAKAAGLEVGTYFYSQALNTTEAAAEANYMLDKIRDQKMDLPVYYDYEFADVSDGRLDVAWKNGTVTKAMMTANVNAFCEVIKNAGYVPGLYSSTDFLNNKYNINDINKDISIWNAHYTSKNSSTGKYAATGFTGDYEMWQYSSKGQVYGVHLEKGDNTDGSKYYDVDCNFLYRELMDAKMNGSQFAMSTIKDQAYTGSEVTPKFTLYYQGKELVKDKDYTVVFSDNIKIGTAKITITGINDYAEAGVWVQSFKIVPTKVENLTLTGQTTTSVSFKWDAHPDATRYRVQTYKNNKWKTYKDTKNTYFSITGLSPGETVKVRVGPIKTINSVDYVGKSCDGVDMTAAPEKVISIKNTVKSVNTIKLTWK